MLERARLVAGVTGARCRAVVFVFVFVFVLSCSCSCCRVRVRAVLSCSCCHVRAVVFVLSCSCCRVVVVLSSCCRRVVVLRLVLVLRLVSCWFIAGIKKAGIMPASIFAPRGGSTRCQCPPRRGVE